MRKKIMTGIIAIIFAMTTTPFALATDYEVELVVADGKKSKETDAVLTVSEQNLSVTPDKQTFKQHTKNFAYSDIKSADYSYSKKPMLSGGGAIATAIFVGILVIPFLFMKKKNHWLSVQTEKEFAVLKLDGSNFRAIVAELKTHGVDVKEVKEEEEKAKK